jgi:two-component system aerobic respiration control sensor histidine kinase ArcB
MIPDNVKYITDALDEIFPANLFLVNENGKIRWANNRLIKCSGFSELKAIRGKHVSMFGEKEWHQTKKVAESKKSETSYESTQDKDFLTIKTPYTQGGFQGVIGLSFDITVLKQAERAREEFFLNIAHDIRTPLAGIIGTLEILNEEDVDPERKEKLQNCLHASHRLLDFLNDAQETKQNHRSLDYTQCNMQALLDDTVLLFNAAAKLKALAIETYCSAAEVMTDRFRIQKILINLLSNAIKYTTQGSVSVVITAEENLHIRVSDSGIGIDKIYQNKIFEEYFQITPAYQQQKYCGIGKGLYLVKQYVTELGGSIRCKSSLNEGSSFIIEIPL